MKSKIKYLAVLLLAFAGCTLISIGGHKRSPEVLVGNNAAYAKTAVMVTDPSRRSGGTGVILDSNPGISHVLTNMHVCGLVQNGGKVITDDGTTYPVDGYRIYKKHDLCLIDIYSDLKVNVKVSDKGPEEYETSIVVGHPSLLPTMITVGHFSKRQQIQIVVGMEECDGTENEEDAMMCAFFGGKPIVRQFQAQATSSLIMPGSSGSAVYNSKGELSGLIFAGTRGLSYGYLVPWEYVRNFLNNKEKFPLQTPDPKKQPENFFIAGYKFEQKCNESNSVRPAPGICKTTSSIGIWYK